ncbi:uncharacterized protein LOC119991462 [Tripterygium wilfordii]|uniref:uncharacterized protein LOC119991462 n=1 Tax=Tripterygium wilfordii TaxID=458696 RepID=UPI0018F82E73|nr:uncharacterized protein LOC119991462 [Tripterygium wilfordii]
MQPYIISFTDVKADGNCGFSAIAVLLGLGEDAWPYVRRDLIFELRTFWNEYIEMYGSYDHAISIYHSLSFFESHRSASLEYWMTMPDMRHLIACKYNVIHILSPKQCDTYLPLRSIPPPTDERVSMTTGFVNDNHYVPLSLADRYPMPFVMIQWFKYKYECEADWVTPYNEQLALFV